MPVAFCSGVPERQAKAWLVRVGCQVPAIGVQGAFEEHPLDPLVVVEILDVPQVGHGDADACVQVGCAVPGDLEVVRCRQGRPAQELVMPPQRVTSSCRQSTAPTEMSRAESASD
jgi:hypothetical protein